MGTIFEPSNMVIHQCIR